MFRNSKGYADPTAGAALARLSYAERQRVREASQNVDEAMAREHGDTVRIKRSRWVKAWPRDPKGPVQQIRNGGKAIENISHCE